MLAPSAPPTPFTLAKVAQFVRVSVKTAEHGVRCGQLPGGFMVGKHWLFDRQTVLDHLERLRGGKGGEG